MRVCVRARVRACVHFHLFIYPSSGFDGVPPTTEWGPEVAGSDDDRCRPSQLMYNCESLPRKPRNGEAIRVVLPANLKSVRVLVFLFVCFLLLCAVL